MKRSSRSTQRRVLGAQHRAAVHAVDRLLDAAHVGDVGRRRRRATTCSGRTRACSRGRSRRPRAGPTCARPPRARRCVVAARQRVAIQSRPAQTVGALPARLRVAGTAAVAGGSTARGRRRGRPRDGSASITAPRARARPASGSRRPRAARRSRPVGPLERRPSLAVPIRPRLTALDAQPRRAGRPRPARRRSRRCRRASSRRRSAPGRRRRPGPGSLRDAALEQRTQRSGSTGTDDAALGVSGGAILRGRAAPITRPRAARAPHDQRRTIRSTFAPAVGPRAAGTLAAAAAAAARRAPRRRAARGRGARWPARTASRARRRRGRCRARSGCARRR